MTPQQIAEAREAHQMKVNTLIRQMKDHMNKLRKEIAEHDALENHYAGHATFGTF